MSPTPFNPPSALIAALRKVLRPLVRFMMSHGVTQPYLTGLLKEIYVEVAQSDFQLDEKAPSDSRISLLTGVHRKDVRRLRGAPTADSTPPQAVSLGAQVIATWISEKRYLTRDGRPKALAIKTAGGREKTFEDLVISVSRQDLRPRVVLDELHRLGIVSIDADRVKLEIDAFVPASGFDEKAHYFAQNLHDHIAAAANNLDSKNTPLLERAVTYHQLNTENVEELKQLAERHAMDGLKAVNARARQLKKANKGKTEANKRINFGVYFYTDEPRDDDES